MKGREKKKTRSIMYHYNQLGQVVFEWNNKAILSYDPDLTLGYTCPRTQLREALS